MAFGQQAGPPASHRQLQDLQRLLEQAGYGTFREARGPFQLNQRQGSGKFTASEADELIERLSEADADPDLLGVGPVDAPVREAPAPSARKAEAVAASLRGVSAGVLAAELERRGWTCTMPPKDWKG